MFIADTHLLGPKEGHWFDKLRRSISLHVVCHLIFIKKEFIMNYYFREWQMYRVFQTMMSIHGPEVVFVLGIYIYIDILSQKNHYFSLIYYLGDVFDEGQWCSSTEFENYMRRFYSLFYVPKDTRLYVVAGNHDMGFHYGRVVYKDTLINICLSEQQSNLWFAVKLDEKNIFLIIFFTFIV